MQTPIELPEHYQHGIVIRDELRTWEAIERQFVCRSCGALLGAPYVDPETGAISHEIKTCHGIVPHPILAERDVVAKGKYDWERDRAAERDHEARQALGLRKELPASVTARLYDKAADGFEL